MSSGVEADIALDLAVVTTLGLNRVLGGVAGLAGAGAQALAALAEGKAEDRAAALAEVERYGRAVHAAIERNARIVALAESARRATGAAPVALPKPLTRAELAARTETELIAWCTATDTVLAEAERALSAGLAAEMASRVFALPPGSLRADLGRPAGREAAAGTAAPAGTPGDGDPATQASGPADDHAERVEALARVLSRLPADTAEADIAHVGTAAERFAGAATAGEAEGLLNEVRLRVQAAGRRAREQRAELRRLAAEREAREQAEAERRYVLETVAAAFGDLGYQVDAGFETLSPDDGTMVLTRGDRPDHAVRMRVDQAVSLPAPPSAPPLVSPSMSPPVSPSAATLRAALVRTRAPESEEERRVDIEREREWCEAFEAARRRLTEAGVGSAVTWRVEPGDQTLPVTPEARHTRARTRQREQERQRAREAGP